ncbi:MAG: transketolase C-terminal domain-containing protein [Planctomycetales bacterium]
MTVPVADAPPQPSTKFIYGMRDQFFDALYEIAQTDRDLVLISADNGAPTMDQFVDNLPGQFYTVGIAEQQMIGMACGMATEGKMVYTYAIAPFVTTRVHEQNKLDICAMNLPIVNLGVGAGYAYDIMGPTHHTVEDITIMRVLPNLTIFSPADGVTAGALAEISYRLRSPQYIRFDRSGIPDIYTGWDLDFEEGLIETRRGADVCLVATGIMVHQALEVADALAERGVQAAVVDLFRLKPINEQKLLSILARFSKVVTLEEHLLAGGMGSALAEIFVDRGVTTPLLRIGQNDRFVFELGGREVIWEKSGLDVPGILRQIDDWSRERGLA